jgi:hypothetical protein
MSRLVWARLASLAPRHAASVTRPAAMFSSTSSFDCQL